MCYTQIKQQYFNYDRTVNITPNMRNNIDKNISIKNKRLNK